MPEYKLYYFNMRGIAEVPRQLLALAGVPFEDIRIAKDDWPEFKNKMPFGHIPVLSVDGKMLPQSFAISRYIAREHGLDGSSSFEAAWVDALADQGKDFQKEFSSYWRIKMGYTEGDVEAAKIEHGIPARDKFFPLIVKQLQEAGSGFLVGSSVTWIDVLLANHVASIEQEDPGDKPRNVRKC